MIDPEVRRARVAPPPVGTTTAGATTVVAGATVVVLALTVLDVVEEVGAACGAATTSALGVPAGVTEGWGPASTGTTGAAMCCEGAEGVECDDELTRAGMPTDATAATAVAASVPIAGASRLGAARTSGGAAAAAAVACVTEAVA